MTAKELILSRRVPKFHEVTIEVLGGAEVKFQIPLSGVALASFEKRCDEWATGRPNGVFVGQGLMPAEGFDVNLARLLFCLMDWNQEKWSQKEVLEMFDANPEEITGIGVKLAEIGFKKQDESKAQELDEELKN